MVRYVKSNDYEEIPIPLQLVITLLFMVYFENVLPKIDARYTGDILDVIAYAAGFILFIIVEGNNKSKKSD